MLLVITLYPSKNACGQAKDTTSQGLQIGIKFTVSDKLLWNKAAEVSYLKPNVRWAVGYQYFNTFSSYDEYMEGVYGEADFLSINFTDDLRLGFPLRLYYGSSPFGELFMAFLSAGSNLHYRINEYWEIGLELGYFGYGRDFSQEYDYEDPWEGLYDGPGISIYYAF